MKKIILFSLIAIISLTGCDNPFWSNSTDKQPVIEDAPISYTYDDEAALMAMSYYNLYTPVDSIAQRIYDELRILKLSFPDTTTFINYTPLWHPSIISLTLNEEILSSIIDSSDTIFYNFLESIDADSLHFCTNLGEGFEKFASIYLHGLKNPTIQILPLEALPQVIKANISSSPGDKSNIFPYFEDNNSKYFYMFRWGDCPSGCMYSSTYYFEIENDKVILNGTYNTMTDTIDRPPWTDTLKMAFDRWRYSE